MKYLEIIEQISVLKRDADRLRRKELASVIREIKSQIKTYGITAEDLGFDALRGASSPQRGQSTSKKGIAGRRSGRKVAPKYADSNGNSWSGRGKQPNWLKTYLSNGGDLAALLVNH